MSDTTFEARKDGQLVLDFRRGPGALISLSAPPPPPGQEPPVHPFLDGTAHVPTEEGRLRQLLDASHGFDEFVVQLVEAGYEVRRRG